MERGSVEGSIMIELMRMMALLISEDFKGAKKNIIHERWVKMSLKSALRARAKNMKLRHIGGKEILLLAQPREQLLLRPWKEA